MAYRGDDLDLRTTIGRSTTGPRRIRAEDAPGFNGHRVPANSYRGQDAETLWVDETVLACANHAYDVAVTYGSREVRIMHLLHALTRIDAAARVLEQQGVHESALRRETLSRIAQEASATGDTGITTPRTSAEYATILRQASDRGRRRGGLASVDDVVYALRVYDRHNPAIDLLWQHAPDWQSADTVVEWDARAQPSRAAYVPETAPYYEPMPRYRAPIRQTMYRDEFGSNLETLELSVRALHGEIMSDRRALTELIREIRGDNHALRGDIVGQINAVEAAVGELTHNRPQITEPLIAKLEAMETALDGRLQEATKVWSVLAERLQSLERSNGTAINESRSVLERLGAMSERLHGLEKSLGSAVGEELKGVKQAVLSAMTNVSRAEWPEAVERFNGIEAALGTQRSETAALRTALADEIRSMRQSLMSQRAAPSDGIGQLTERVNEIARLIVEIRTAPNGELATRLDQRLGALETRLRDLLASNAPGWSNVADGLGRLEQLISRLPAQSVEAPGFGQELGELHEALVKLGSNQVTLASNQQSLSGSLEQWRLDSTGDLSIISNRLDALEKQMSESVAMTRSGRVQDAPVQPAAFEPATDKSRPSASDPRRPTPHYEEVVEEGNWWFKRWLFGTDRVWASGWGSRDRSTINER